MTATDQTHPPTTAPEPLLAAWIKWTMHFWEAMTQMGPGLSRGAGTSAPDAVDTGELTLKLWQAFFSLLSEPATVDVVFKGINPPSEIMLKMAQAGWSGYFYLYQQWLEGVEGEESPPADDEFEDLEQDVFSACNDIFENDFRRLLNLFQMGLTRTSPELVHQAVAKFTQFQAAMSEFIYLLALPMKKSLRAVQEEHQPAENGKLPQDFKDYYRRWLRLLEGGFMTLFQSPEYTRTLSYVLEALEDFHLAQQDLQAEALGALGIPTQWDVDELYRELYLLKKQVKELTRTINRQEPAP